MHTLIAFFIVIGVLIFAHELGHFLAARYCGVRVEKFSLGFGPKMFGRTVGDTEYLISWIPLGGYVKLLGEETEEGEKPGEAKALSPEERKRSFGVQPLWKRVTIVAAGPVFNFVLAYFIFTGILMSGYPMLIPKFESLLPVIDAVSDDSPAQMGGMMSGDRIISIDGKEISTWNQMTEIVQRKPDEKLEFEVDRQGKTIKLALIPERKTIKTSDDEEVEIGQIGISKEMKGTTIEVTGPVEALYKGFDATYRWTELTVVGIGKLITGKISMDNIGSPIMIAQISGDAASQGILTLMVFIAILSVNLGIINALPILPLDGGHLFFFGIEAVRSRPVSNRKRELATQFGMVLLVLLMLRAFYNDLVRWIGG